MKFLHKQTIFLFACFTLKVTFSLHDIKHIAENGERDGETET